jgi:hypothetical protein
VPDADLFASYRFAFFSDRLDLHSSLRVTADVYGAGVVQDAGQAAPAFVVISLEACAAGRLTPGTTSYTSR